MVFLISPTNLWKTKIAGDSFQEKLFNRCHLSFPLDCCQLKLSRLNLTMDSIYNHDDGK